MNKCPNYGMLDCYRQERSATDELARLRKIEAARVAWRKLVASKDWQDQDQKNRILELLDLIGEGKEPPK